MATSNSNMTVLLQNDSTLPCSSEVLTSLWLPSSSPSFHGSKSMVSFEKEGNDASFAEVVGKEENEEEDYDGACYQPPGKKRRLSARQVEFLEKSFEVENKLEPERKVQLAAELGLQPRQVAIWFQNRRARYKTKQLEKDFAILRATFDTIKSDYDDLLKHNQALKLEVNSLKAKLAGKEKGNECLGLENGISTSSLEEPQNLVAKTPRCDEEGVSNVPISSCKQEDASSAKSDVSDSTDSPHCAENNYSSLAESRRQAFEPAEQSDFSQDEEEDLIIPSALFLPKLEDCCYDGPPASSCHLGFTAEDQPFNFWPY